MSSSCLEPTWAGFVQLKENYGQNEHRGGLGYPAKDGVVCQAGKVGRGLNSFMEGAVSGAGDETSSVIIHWKQEDDTDIFLHEAD